MVLQGKQKFIEGSYNRFLGPNFPQPTKKYSSRYSIVSMLNFNKDLGIGTLLFFQSLWWMIMVFASIGLFQGFIACMQWFQHTRYFFHILAIIVWPGILVAYSFFHKRLIYRHQMKLQAE